MIGFPILDLVRTLADGVCGQLLQFLVVDWLVYVISRWSRRKRTRNNLRYVIQIHSHGHVQKLRGSSTRTNWQRQPCTETSHKSTLPLHPILSFQIRKNEDIPKNRLPPNCCPLGRERVHFGFLHLWIQLCCFSTKPRC